MRYLKSYTEWPKIAVYDIESANWVDSFLYCHVDEYGNRVRFASASDYIDWLLTKFPGSHIWAHYGGRYDHRFLIPELYKRGIDMKASLSGGSIVIFTIEHQGKRLHFCDSYRLMPDSLKKIGKTVGLEKLDFDRGQIDKERYDTDPVYQAECIEYCYRDCDIVLKGLQLMRTALTASGCDFAFTLASIATRWIRHSPVIDWGRFYTPVSKKSLKYNDMLTEVDAWCEPARHGGRTEMFFEGVKEGPIEYLDIISSYPYAMTKELPLYFQGFYPPPKKLTPSSLLEYLSHCGITEATVTIPRCRIGPLPVNFGGKLLFPYGRITSRWTNIELVAALRRGCQIEPHYQARFEPKAFMRPFVDTFYSLRKKATETGDEFQKYTYKILLNSAYGKLGETIDRVSFTTSKDEIERAKEQRRQQLRKRGFVVADDADLDVVKKTKIAGLYCLCTEEEGPFRHIAAASYILAYARLRLLEGLELVLAKGGDILYCDTDSIMSTVPLPELYGENLGQWKHEYTLSRVELIAPKVYRSEIVWPKPGIEYRCKGMPMRREGDTSELTELRWQAFKRYNQTADKDEAARMAKALANDGMTGFKEDIKDGSIHPRSKSRAGKSLIRKQMSTDRKRDWTVFPSSTLHVNYCTLGKACKCSICAKVG